MAICEFCGKEHNGSYGTGRFCSKICKDKYAGRKAGDTLKKKYKDVPIKKIKKVCEKCGKEFEVEDTYDKRKRRFCSRTCANGHIHTKETIEKIRQSQNKAILNKSLNLRQYNKNGTKSQKLAKPQLLTCEICGKEFEHYWHNKRHTCYDPICVSKYLSLKTKENPNIGGHRPNSGNGKSGWYKGISCQSTYELAWVIYNLDHNVKFQKCKKVFEYEVDGQIHKYYPDFELQDGTIIEIKGYYQNTVKLKQQAVLQQGYKYKILYKKDLKVCFDYIKENYNVSKENLIMLYDENKGYIEKNCIICGKQFKTRNVNQITCSRSCNGKYVQSKRKLI